MVTINTGSVLSALGDNYVTWTSVEESYVISMYLRILWHVVHVGGNYVMWTSVEDREDTSEVLFLRIL